jgi:hypothetical protein
VLSSRSRYGLPEFLLSEIAVARVSLSKSLSDDSLGTTVPRIPEIKVWKSITRRQYIV